MNINVIPVGKLQTNCCLISSSTGSAAIVDPGADAPAIIDKLMELGEKPVMILLTHAHYDHTGAIRALQAHFGKIPVCIGTGDIDMLTDPKISLGNRMAAIAKDYEGLTYDRVLQDGDTVEFDDVKIKVITTPGHTKGGVCYVTENVIFSGDTLFRREVGRCDLYGGSFDAIKNSIAKLYTLEGDYRVYTGHGDDTTLNEERAENPYVRG